MTKPIPNSLGRGWHGEPEAHADAGRMGGAALVAKRGSEHMRAIGGKGGRSVSRDRAHMQKIGRLGGLSSGKPQPANEEATEQGE